MSWLKSIGTHLHLSSNITDFSAAVAAATAGMLGIPVGGTTGQALVKDSATDGDATWHNIEDLATAETVTTKRMAPNGTGGVGWVAGGSSGITAVRTYISFGDQSAGQSYTP